MKFCLFLVLSHFFGRNFRGFSKFSSIDYVKWKQENRIAQMLLGCHGPLANRQFGRAFLQATF
ncbi:unnamed protein product [Coffea canephora]|uniref:Uncharacterized protein n=1 Tax=Coffea canephora TaxID=49390 RepID=A0A068V4Z9_COFCA|nr:unnamed protein product [Coffea canephora]